MAASTVVVGFATGGVPEMIQNGSNGFLVDPTDQIALNEVLRQALLSPRLADLGRQAHKDVTAYFSKTSFLEKHLHLYETAKEYGLHHPTCWIPPQTSTSLATKTPPCP
jgi:glycosyltransferase involved in cell wall biosynthesis